MARGLDGNDFSVYYDEQTAKGAINATPDFTPIRRVSGRALEALTFVQSEEVKSNRQGKENIIDARDFSAEVAAESTEQTIFFLQACLQNTETPETVAGTTIASDANGFTGIGSEFANLEVGDYIFASGFTDAGLNRTYKITAKASDSDIETSPAPSVVEAAGASVSIVSNKTISAKTPRYFAIQNRIYDESKAGNINYQTFFDHQVSVLALEIGESGIITNTITLAGESKVDGTAIISGQTDNAADASKVLSAANDVVTFWVDGVTENCVVKSMSLEVNNNLQEDIAAGCGKKRSNGDLTVSSSIVARNTVDNSMRWDADFKATTTHAFAVELDHGGGKYTVIEIRKGRITEHTIEDGSNVVAASQMTVAGEEDATLNQTIAVYRNW